MAVLPINGFSARSNYMTSMAFTSRSKNCNNGECSSDDCKINNKLATVPVAVLMAMSPLNSVQAAEKQPLEPEVLTEYVVPAENEDAAESAAVACFYEASAASPQDYGFPILKNYTIKHKQAAVTIDGISFDRTGANILFTNIGLGKTNPNVTDVFLVRNGDKPKSYTERPPKITGLVYHEPEGKAPFCGVLTVRHTKGKGDDMLIVNREYRLDDTSAQKLIDFMAGETNMIDHSKIKYYKSTSSNLSKITVEKY